jgi:hypothetical protein
MADTNATGRMPTVADIPIEKIKEAVERGINEVQIRVQRRNHRGQLQTLVTQWRIPTPEIVDLEGQLARMAGGGQYRVECMSLVDPLDQVIPAFQINIEGPPRPIDTQAAAGAMSQPAPVGLPSQHGGPMFNSFPQIPGVFVGQQSQGAPMPLAGPVGAAPMYSAPQGVPGATGWAAGLHPFDQHAYLRPGAAGEVHLPPGASLASDQIALKQVADLKAELAEAKALREAVMTKLEAEREAHTEEVKKIFARIEKSEAEAKDREHKLQLEMMEKRFTAQLEKLSVEKSQKRESIADYAPVMAALAPVLTAMLTSGRDVTAKAAESQAALMQTFITTNAQKKDSSTLETIKVLAPILAPMALKMMESRGPDAQSKAYEVLADSNMQQMAMMAQFIQTMAASQGDQSPWVPFLQQAAGGIMETIGAYMESKKQAQQQPPRLIHQGHAQPLPAPRPEAQQQGVAYSTEEAPTDTTAEATSADTKPSKPDATQVTNLIMANPAVPAQYKTNDWAAVIYAVHDLQPIKNTVGAYLAQLEKISPNFPPGLHDVAENPAGATRRLLEALPVWRYAPVYVNQFVIAVEREVMGEGDEAAVVEDDYQPPGTPTAAPAQPVMASTKLTTVPASEQPQPEA